MHNEFVVLVGPPGCGKLTTLRMIAGLEDISDGAISIGSEVVNDLPPRKRNISMMFQNYALYSHMSVRELTRVLDITVVRTEILAKHPYSVAECIATRTVKAVRADASWSGGVTGVLKTLHLAESFHMKCELHSTTFHPLEMENLHLAGAVHDNSFFEVLWPMDKFDFGLESLLPISDGVANLPEGAGLVVDLNWDLIENATLEVV